MKTQSQRSDPPQGTEDLELEAHSLALGQSLYVGATRISNYSELPTGRLLSLLPAGYAFEEVVFMPDVCPGKSKLPTGTAVRTRDPNWRELAVSDCGCGMQLISSDLDSKEFLQRSHLWDKLGIDLKQNKGTLGDLGGGNHFLDAIVDYETDKVSFLIHTGSRLESGLVDHLVHNPREFDKEFHRVVGWAHENRDVVAECVRKVYGDCRLELDMPHNTFEICGDGSVVIRKGVVKAVPGKLVVLPSHMTGDVAVLEPTAAVEQTLFSLSHGTGRALSRSAAKEIPTDFTALRKAIYLPDYISDSSIKTESPGCYRNLDRCLELLSPLVVPQRRLAVVAYLGHL